MSENWSKIGWQGVTLQAPAGWNLVGVSGDEKKGYFRVDSPESSSVEVRWTAARQAPGDLTVRAKEFLSALEKAGKKRRVKFTSKVKARKPTPAEELYGGSSVGFTWKGDRNAYGRVLYCGYCKRLVVAQVVENVGENVSGAASQILGSICEHEKPGWNVWALYDLAVPIPEGFRLEKHMLMSSFVELSFRKRNETVVVQRWGLAANQLLKKRSLEEWADQAYLPGIKGYRLEKKSPSIGDDQDIVFSGVRKPLMSPMALSKLLMGKGAAKNLSGCAWYCEESNRVYAVRRSHNGEDDLVDVLRNEIECH